MDLTPLEETSSTLELAPAGTLTLVAVDERTETLSAMGEIIRSTEFLHASSSTFPGATTYPGEYGQITGHAFTVLDERDESLSPLVEA